MISWLPSPVKMPANCCHASQSWWTLSPLELWTKVNTFFKTLFWSQYFYHSNKKVTNIPLLPFTIEEAQKFHHCPLKRPRWWDEASPSMSTEPSPIQNRISELGNRLNSSVFTPTVDLVSCKCAHRGQGGLHVPVFTLDNNELWGKKIPYSEFHQDLLRPILRMGPWKE